MFQEYPLSLVAGGIAPPQGSRFDAGCWEAESMLIKTHSRFMVRHDLVLKAARNRGEALRLHEAKASTLDVLSMLQAAVKEGKAVHVIENDDIVELTKVVVRPKDNIAILLFQRSDPNAPAPVFANKKKKTLRLVAKEADEAEAISAHLFLSLEEKDEDGIYSYRAVMEEMPGLGRSYMHAVISAVVKEQKYEYEDAHGDIKETYTIPVFHGVPSENIGDALKTGVISFIELVRPPNVSGLDTDGLIPRPERMRLSLKAQTMKKALGIIQRVQDWRDSKHWRDLRVQVKTADKRSRMVPIAREEDAADVLFVHAEEVTTKKPLSQCTDKINEELVGFAEEIFSTDKDWKSD